jgi:tetratricopeptide (TPR) repeat protein
MSETEVEPWSVPWRLLQCGELDVALEQLREEYKAQPQNRERYNYGAALMWARRYESAAEHFQQAIEAMRNSKTAPWLGDSDYVLLGAAKWCLKDYPSAVKAWKQGINAPYATLGVCLETPILLNLASILNPEISMPVDLPNVLPRKLKDPRVRGWLGALAKYITGVIDDEELDAQVSEYVAKTRARGVDPSEPYIRWIVGFCKATESLKLNGSSRSNYCDLMKSITSATEFVSWNWQSIVYSARRGELYLARHEAENK